MIMQAFWRAADSDDAGVPDVLKVKKKRDEVTEAHADVVVCCQFIIISARCCLLFLTVLITGVLGVLLSARPSVREISLQTVLVSLFNGDDYYCYC